MPKMAPSNVLFCPNHKLITLHFIVQQNSDEDKVDVDIIRCIFQQYKTSICVRSILNILFSLCHWYTQLSGLVWILTFSFFLLEISETITYQRCHGERFRTSTHRSRKCRVFVKQSVLCNWRRQVSHVLFFFLFNFPGSSCPETLWTAFARTCGSNWGC